MKPKNLNPINTIIFWLLVGFSWFMLMMATLTSCESIKAITKTKQDSTSVKTVDSTKVVNTNNTSNKSDEWFKETLTLMIKGMQTQGGGDTTINNNNYIPVYYTREGGKRQENTTSNTQDSTNLSKKDTTAVQAKETQRNTSTEFMGPKTILAFFIGMGIFAAIILFMVFRAVQQNAKVLNTVTELIKRKPE